MRTSRPSDPASTSRAAPDERTVRTSRPSDYERSYQAPPDERTARTSRLSDPAPTSRAAPDERTVRTSRPFDYERSYQAPPDERTVRTLPPERPRPPEPDALYNPPVQPSRWRSVYHLLIAIAGWVLFGWWWWIVLQRTGSKEVRFTVTFILVALFLAVAWTAIWVFHNLRIYKRRGPRTNVRNVWRDFTRDPLGRAVTFRGDMSWIQSDPMVEVDVEQGPDHEAKRYRSTADIATGRQAGGGGAGVR